MVKKVFNKIVISATVKTRTGFEKFIWFDGDLRTFPGIKKLHIDFEEGYNG